MAPTIAELEGRRRMRREGWVREVGTGEWRGPWGGGRGACRGAKEERKGAEERGARREGRGEKRKWG